jgi:hypothetical protein
VFELGSASSPWLGNGTHLLHPFAVLQVEAVVGNAVKRAEIAGARAPGSLWHLFLHGGPVMPKEGIWTQIA